MNISKETRFKPKVSLLSLISDLSIPEIQKTYSKEYSMAIRTMARKRKFGKMHYVSAVKLLSLILTIEEIKDNERILDYFDQCSILSNRRYVRCQRA